MAPDTDLCRCGEHRIYYTHDMEGHNGPGLAGCPPDANCGHHQFEAETEDLTLSILIWQLQHRLEGTKQWRGFDDDMFIAGRIEELTFVINKLKELEISTSH